MDRLRIPAPFLIGFKRLAELESSKIEEISQFLRTVPIGTGRNTFKETFYGNFDDLQETGVAETIFSIASVHHYYEGQYVSDTALSQMLVESYKDQQKQVEDTQVLEKLETTLQTILASLSTLYYSFKAFDLLSEDKSVFVAAHIVSDIRLIFNKNDISQTTRQSVIVHRLKINATENAKDSEYFFSLDTNDLKKLKEQIERAEKKEKLIRDQYRDAIEFITITE